MVVAVLLIVISKLLPKPKGEWGGCSTNTLQAREKKNGDGDVLPIDRMP